MSIISILITLCAVTLFLRAFLMQKYKTQDINKFVVQNSRLGSLAFIGWIMFASFRSYWSYHTTAPELIETNKKAGNAFLFSAIVVFIFLLFYLGTKLKYNNGKIKVFSLFPLITGTYALNGITRTKQDLDGGITLYFKDKPFYVDKDAMGIRELKYVLNYNAISNNTAQQNIKEKYITKKSFLFNSTIYALLGLGLFLGVMVLFLSDNIIDGILIGIVIILIIYLTCIPFTLKGYLFLKKEEKDLNINFDQEMAIRKITGVGDHDWFICSNGLRNLAIRRDYIKEISEIKGTNNAQGIGQYVIIKTITEDIYKTNIDSSSLKEFIKWYYELGKILNITRISDNEVIIETNTSFLWYVYDKILTSIVEKISIPEINEEYDMFHFIMKFPESEYLEKEESKYSNLTWILYEANCSYILKKIDHNKIKITKN